ncbi:MAG: DUF1223 domain-containing protein [Chitinophaga sp.]|uniref:DUF1223 domain-containing protein n=1 Tax=Chitinophaga sp. TaxID=1869181 RepID=UPI001B193268|nr:DUF1223 domain-containing protein [Chitinophaga sp.]MBO9730247.1 DUF1223 domain-containing protein [Chitinophaga sp.]
MKTIMISSIFALLLGACNISYGSNSRTLLPATDSTNGFAVVELFTSEGCSSCPPADELLARLEKESQGKPLYLLAFHVDYWDHQGWKDSFSQHTFSERQEAYAAWLHLNSVYTPQVVINGTSQYVGSDAGNIIGRINDAFNANSGPQLVLEGQPADGKMNVSWTVTMPQKHTRLHLAFVQKNAQSNVRAGENAGRKLSHVQIVQQLTTVDPDKSQHAMVNIPAGFNSRDWELIGFVQRNSDGKIIAAGKATIAHQ